MTSICCNGKSYPVHGHYDSYPAGNYMLKVNNRNTLCKTRCKICSKLTIKTPERRH